MCEVPCSWKLMSAQPERQASGSRVSVASVRTNGSEPVPPSAA
jgi:hypothetical protein